MLIGLNTLKTVSQNTQVATAWFTDEEAAPVAAPQQSTIQIRPSLKSVSRATTAVPSLPRHAQKQTQAAWSPYQAMSSILESSSRSSRWLAQYGLFQQFASTDCFVDMSMTPDGGMSAVLRSPAGFRRTVVCRPDGSVSQRITGPRGEEIVRFNNDGDPVYSQNKAEAQLAIA
jgi:hypothetical protein